MVHGLDAIRSINEKASNVKENESTEKITSEQARRFIRENYGHNQDMMDVVSRNSLSANDAQVNVEIKIDKQMERWSNQAGQAEWTEGIKKDVYLLLNDIHLKARDLGRSKEENNGVEHKDFSVWMQGQCGRINELIIAIEKIMSDEADAKREAIEDPSVGRCYALVRRKDGSEVVAFEQCPEGSNKMSYLPIDNDPVIEGAFTVLARFGSVSDAYCHGHKGSGIEVGDLVRVHNVPKYYSQYGWDGNLREARKFEGETVRVTEDGGQKGFLSGGCYFPYYCLRKLTKKVRPWAFNEACIAMGDGPMVVIAGETFEECVVVGIDVFGFTLGEDDVDQISYKCLADWYVLPNGDPCGVVEWT